MQLFKPNYVHNKSNINVSRESREAAEREVMFPEAPLGIGKNYLIHRSDLLYLILFT